MKIKTSELTGAALDWAVALIEYPEWKEQGFLEVFPYDLSFDDGTTYAPSTDWSRSGPIIEREGILLRPLRKDGLFGLWLAMYDGDNTGSLVRWLNSPWAPRNYSKGPTPLIAAMRCYVASKFGDEVEMPEELK